MVGWHHRPNEYEFEQTPGIGDGQGSLVCCSPWGHRESDTTEQPNNNSKGQMVSFLKSYNSIDHPCCSSEMILPSKDDVYFSSPCLQAGLSDLLDHENVKRTNF